MESRRRQPGNAGCQAIGEISVKNPITALGSGIEVCRASQHAVIFSRLVSHLGRNGNPPEKMHAHPGSHKVRRPEISNI